MIIYKLHGIPNRYCNNNKYKVYASTLLDIASHYTPPCLVVDEQSLQIDLEMCEDELIITELVKTTAGGDGSVAVGASTYITIRFLLGSMYSNMFNMSPE